jgi:hypothetical protein
MMRYLTQLWKKLTPNEQNSWEPLAHDFNITAFNAFIRWNQDGWHANETPHYTPGPDSGTTPPPPGTMIAQGRTGHAQLREFLSYAPTRVGWIIYRSQDSNEPNSARNAIAIRPEPPASHYATYTDSPLAPGTYYYWARAFNKTGRCSDSSIRKTTIPPVT